MTSGTSATKRTRRGRMGWPLGSEMVGERAGVGPPAPAGFRRAARHRVNSVPFQNQRGLEYVSFEQPTLIADKRHQFVAVALRVRKLLLLERQLHDRFEA